MLKKILLGLAAVVVVLLVVIATRPGRYEVKRSLQMKAPPSVVYAQVSDFHAWDGWSPWDKMDPAMKRTYGEVASGVGATYSWVGNDQVGEGKMTITEAKPGERVTIDLEFIKPFASKTVTEFTLAGSGEGTNVTWAMSGENDFMGKAFSLVMDMDKAVGGDFERGLAEMKTRAEGAAVAAQKAADEAAAAAAAAAPATEDAGTP